MITTVSDVRRAMTPTKVPTNTETGTASGISVLVETVMSSDDLSASVGFTEVTITVLYISSSSVVEATVSKIVVTVKVVGALDSTKTVIIVNHESTCSIT